MNTGDTTRVVIQFTRTVVRGCPDCEGTGAKSTDLRLGSHVVAKADRSCPACLGTGKVRVRVSGEVEIWEFQKSRECVTYRTGIYGVDIPIYYGTAEQLPDTIIQAHLAGELPAEIAAHIKEEPVE